MSRHDRRVERAGKLHDLPLVSGELQLIPELSHRHRLFAQLRLLSPRALVEFIHPASLCQTTIRRDVFVGEQDAIGYNLYVGKILSPGRRRHPQRQ